ncbi:MAG: MBL fold metallo-hydrolase, partial [Candidatus Marinimicrobia bacterium]|nr:MBL fold metallo-hydrolase [Candidatus Neomarinimicrobiota bacterium]
VIPFSVPHNSIEPLGYSIIAGKKKIGILTDCGFATNLVKERLKDVDLLLIESNYDEEMLKNSSYPWSIKQRISGRLGHLSNKASAKLIAELFKGRKAKVILGHLSENTNTPELAAAAVESALRNNVNESHEIYHAPREGLSGIFNL